MYTTKCHKRFYTVFVRIGHFSLIYNTLIRISFHMMFSSHIKIGDLTFLKTAINF